MAKVEEFNKFDFFNAFSEKQLAELIKVTGKKTTQRVPTFTRRVIGPTRFLLFPKAG
jgi:hypothetical protein